MDWTRLSLKTLITLIPKIWNDNFTNVERSLDVFYDESSGILIKPVVTSGRIKGSTGEFVNVITDNLTVKQQFTNWYENTTTIDMDFVNTYNEGDTSTRIATSDTSTNPIWPYEKSGYSFIDIDTPYIKIGNDLDYGLQNGNLGQEVRIMFNPGITSIDDFTVLTRSFDGGDDILTMTHSEVVAGGWVKLIIIAYDASYGPSWIVKESQGNYTIS